MFYQVLLTRDNNMTKYFHELSSGEKFDIYNLRKSWSATAKKYLQPPWCSHAQAVDGLYGCQDLWIGSIKTPTDCENCKLYKEINKTEFHEAVMDKDILNSLTKVNIMNFLKFMEENNYFLRLEAEHSKITSEILLKLLNNYIEGNL